MTMLCRPLTLCDQVLAPLCTYITPAQLYKSTPLTISLYNQHTQSLIVPLTIPPSSIVIIVTCRHLSPANFVDDLCLERGVIYSRDCALEGIVTLLRVLCDWLPFPTVRASVLQSLPIRYSALHTSIFSGEPPTAVDVLSAADACGHLCDWNG